MIQPTIGRVVWFQPAHSDGVPDLEQPLSASIAYVHSDRCINIGYLDANGIAHNATSVTLLQDDDPVPATGYYAKWMPYQVGQAKKHEVAIEKD